MGAIDAIDSIRANCLKIAIDLRFVLVDLFGILRGQKRDAVIQLPVVLELSEPFGAVVNDVLEDDARIANDVAEMDGASAAETEDSTDDGGRLCLRLLVGSDIVDVPKFNII